MNRCIFSLILVFSFQYFCIGQIRSGLSYGHFNGINATHLNPANSTLSKNNWDLQLLGAHAFFDTDLAWITNTNLIKLIRNGGEVYISDFNDEPIPVDEEMVMNFNEVGRTSSIAHAEVLGPGILFGIGDKWKFGAQARLRTWASAKQIPELINPSKIVNVVEQTDYSFDEFSASTAAWSEYVLHGAYNWSSDISFGVNLKLLDAKVAAWGSNDQNVQFEKLGYTSVDLKEGGEFSFGMTHEPAFNKSNWGFATDIGMVIHNVGVSGSYLGISILDFGFARIKDVQYQGAITTDTELLEVNYENIDNADDFINQLTTDEVLIGQDQNFNIYMPTALSVQYSFSVTPKIRANTSIVQGINFSKKQLARSNTINATLMYEQKYFTAMLPVTIDEFRDPKLGLAVRLAYLTIGTDDLFSFVGNSNFNSTDLYINLQFFPFQVKSKKRKRGNKRSKRSRGDIKCPDFKTNRH